MKIADTGLCTKVDLLNMDETQAGGTSPVTAPASAGRLLALDLGAKRVGVAAEKFQKSLNVPVYLQDERLTTVAATERLKAEGRSSAEIDRRVDSESAKVILADFIALSPSS